VTGGMGQGGGGGSTQAESTRPLQRGALPGALILEARAPIIHSLLLLVLGPALAMASTPVHRVHKPTCP
jgi:hypothetical protein